MQQYYSTYEGFNGESDSENEGFNGDSDSENEGFNGDSDSENEGFKAKSKASKSNKANSKSAKKTGKAIKNSKLGKAVSKAAKKMNKALGISKKAKKFKRAVIDPALIRAQTQARIAQEQLKENELARSAAQKQSAQLMSSISKQVQNPDLKAFNTKKVNIKKSASLIFVAFTLVLAAIVYFIYSFKYGESYVNKIILDPTTSSGSGFVFNAIMVLAILAFIAFFSIIFKGLILRKDITKKHVIDMITSTMTIGLPIFAITLIIIESLPLMHRSFENTFGYWWISGKPLKLLTGKMFGSNGNYNDYSIIATQMNEYNVKAYLTCMKENSDVNLPSLNRFPGIFIGKDYIDPKTGQLKLSVPDKFNQDEKVKDLYDFTNLIVKKTTWGKAMWSIFATVGVFYGVNLLSGNLHV